MIRITNFNQQSWVITDEMNKHLKYLEEELKAEIIKIGMTSKEHGYIVYKV